MRNLIILLLILNFSTGFGQSDSDEVLRLKSHLQNTDDLKKQTGIYNDLAWEYSYSDFDSASHYVEIAINHADELNDPYWKAVSLEMLAILKEISGQNEEAIKLYFEVIPIRESIGGKGLENTYNNMAIIFRTQNNFETAYDYFRQSYLIEVQKNNKEGIAASLINMAITEKHLNRRDSLQHHLWEALSIAKYIDKQDIEAHAMINLGNLHREENNSDSALYYFEEALNLSGNTNKGNEVVINVGLAEIYTNTGEAAKALLYLERAEALAQELHSIEYLKRIYSDKAAVYAAIGDFEQAYVFNKKFFVMNDSLTNLELINQTNELEKKYETERKERQITELELASAEQKLISKAGKDQRRILIFIAIILGLAVWFAFYRYRKEQRTATLLQGKNETIAAALHDREILLKEIHHRVKNNLQVVSSLLSIQGREISDEKALEAVNESKHRVQSMALIHQYLYSENDLKSIDMQQYVQQLSTNLFNAYKLDHNLVKLEVDVDPLLLDVDTAIPLGIIINELITNALKYAFPKNANGVLSVKLHEENQRLNLRVSDNGVGKSAVSGSQISFGTKLINAFKNKLKAELEMNTENGYSVLFSIGNYKKI
ncbi:tetratricopeptide repeat protein [Cryomorpha ignava]|uniref:histidine kinase n=1 Tax=Cryomorpha ignava TaxID=101383 RepID=A0A7K3WR88_9FLAO|nr:histidine kinase dimerization/phosphoacceptor domain -containing protein [Cryomorpha ignava]NEN24190.1 tetratricopeptide repeat protein [Cryomorpha ignava]